MPVNTWTHLAATYNGSVLALYVNGVQAGQLVDRGLARRVDRRAQDRRQLDLGRVVRGRNRRSPHLQPRPQRHRNHGRHGDLDLEPGFVRAVGAGALSAVGWVELGAVVVGCGDRQRRGCALQRPPRDECRLHAVVGEPDRAADRARVHRQRSRPGRTSTGWSPRMRPAISGRPRTRRRPRSVIRSAVCAGYVGCGGGCRAGRRCRGRRRPTTWVWSATTSIAARARASRCRLRTGSRSRRHRATWIPPRRAATSTRSPPRTRPATSARSRTRRRRRCWPTRPRRAQPLGLAGSVVGSTVNLSWTASTDNVAVTRYNLHRCTSAGFTPSAANRIAQPTGPSYADTGLATGSYFYKVTAEDAAGNISAASNEATATVADATPPTAPSSLAAAVAGSTVNLSWAAATDNVGVSRYNLHRGTTSGFTPSAANRIAQPTGLSYADTNVAPGTYFYKLTAEDAAGNIGPVSNTASATVLDTQPAQHTHKPRRHRRRRPDQPDLDRSHRQRRRHAATTSTAHHSGFTPSAGNRIAQPTEHQLHRHRPRRRHLLLQAHRRRRRRQHQHRLKRSHRHRQRPTRHRPRRRLRLRHRQRHHRPRPIRHRQQRHPHQRHLDAPPANTASTRLQRHQRLRHHPRHQQPRPHHRHDPRSLGPTPPTSAPSWRTAILKEATGSMSYGLYANGGDTGTKVPTGEIVNGGFRLAPGTAPLAAQHLDAPGDHVRRHHACGCSSTASRPASSPSPARSPPPQAR